MLARLLALASLALAGSAAIAQGPFLRLVEEDNGLLSRLEVAVKAYEPVGHDGPRVTIASAVHIGNGDYYAQLQRILDAHDVVLFEGVGGGGRLDPRWDAEVSDQTRAEITKRRAELLADLARRTGALSLPSLLEMIGDDKLAIVEPLLVDAWQNPFAMSSVTDDEHGRVGYIASYGADGAPGGEGAAADIIVSPRYLAPPARSGIEMSGVQQKLAAALGLRFQLTEMDSTGANWRNSDITPSTMRDSMRDRDAEGEFEAFFDIMSGEGFSGAIAGGAVRFLGASRTLREIFKAMLVETLPRSDEMLTKDNPLMGDLMEVILHQRNLIVLRDLAEVIADEPEVRSLALIYGAGHLADIEKGLMQDMGYRHVGTVWVNAMESDLSTLGLSSSEAKIIRDGMKASIEVQIQQMGRMKRRN